MSRTTRAVRPFSPLEAHQSYGAQKSCLRAEKKRNWKTFAVMSFINYFPFHQAQPIGPLPWQKHNGLGVKKSSNDSTRSLGVWRRGMYTQYFFPDEKAYKIAQIVP